MNTKNTLEIFVSNSKRCYIFLRDNMTQKLELTVRFMVKEMIIFTVPRTVPLLWPGSVWENKINLIRVCTTGSWETSVTDKLKMSKPHNINTVSFVPMESPCMKVFSHFCYLVCEAIHGKEEIRLQISKVPITEDLHYVLLLSITATSAGNSGHLASHRKSKSETF